MVGIEIAAVLWMAGSGATPEYPADESLLKARDPEVPAEFRDGTATLEQVEAWSRSLIQGEVPLTRRDLTCDGREDLLVEIPFARGTTGNRSFLLFERGDDGYRYRGIVDRVLRTFAFGELCYQVQYSTLGGVEHAFTLLLVDRDELAKRGETVLRIGDGGDPNDNAVFRLLKEGAPTREQLLSIFRGEP